MSWVRLFAVVVSWVSLNSVCCDQGVSAQREYQDTLREFQFRSVELDQSDWIHWGYRKGDFSNWTSHSNRLIPVYSFGVRLDSVDGENSVYRDEARLKALYGQMPLSTLNKSATYFDQTDIYRLQKQAWESGKKHVILIVFDGMDWQTTQAAAIYHQKELVYEQGRGTGLSFLDYKKGDPDFGFCVTSPHDGATKFDVNGQVLTEVGGEKGGGYSAQWGGEFPWSKPADPAYLLGRRKTVPHPYTDSASSATALNTGKKTYNGAINIAPDGSQLETLAHQMQRQGFSIGVVTSVPISHATPACVYSHNVSRNDYQDLTRDLLGLVSNSHRDEPLPGVDVLIGSGWGQDADDLRSDQGRNYIPGNKYLSETDEQAIDFSQGGKYIVAERTPGVSGKLTLSWAAEKAAETGSRLLGVFGGNGGHLPFRTADGNYNSTRGISKGERCTSEEVFENPTLADMTESALKVLEKNKTGFFLMIEAGDVDWANHNNNIDDAIGAVLSGAEAFSVVTNWVEQNSNWEETCVIVTADHGHMMVLDDPAVLTGQRPLGDWAAFDRARTVKQAADAEKRRLKKIAQAEADKLKKAQAAMEAEKKARAAMEAGKQSQ